MSDAAVENALSCKGMIITVVGVTDICFETGRCHIKSSKVVSSWCVVPRNAGQPHSG